MNLSKAPIPPLIPEAQAPSFRMAIWPLAFASLSWSLPISILIILPTVRSFQIGALLSPVLASSIFAFVFMRIVTEFWKYFVDENGIRGFDAWGRRCTMTWAQMQLVRPTRFFHMRYLRVYGDGLRPLWLPLFFSDRAAFVRAVDQSAPPDHLLRQFLPDEFALPDERR